VDQEEPVFNVSSPTATNAAAAITLINENAILALSTPGANGINNDNINGHKNWRLSRSESLSASMSHETLSWLSSSPSTDNLSALNRRRSMALNKQPKTKQEEVKLKNEMNNRKENFESVDFFSTIASSGQDDEESEEEEEEEEETTEQAGQQKQPDENELNEPDINYNEVQEINGRRNLLTVRKKQRKIWKKTKRIFWIIFHPLIKLMNPLEVKAIIFLAILGVLGALANLFTDLFLTKLDRARNEFSVLTTSYAGNYIIIIAYSICFSWLAAACTHFISPFSSGSGIPEMKSILSGNSMERYLSFPTLVAKLLGIVASVASG
jgi:hypothetical protein